ncbi:MAG: hypothetical protein JKY37_33540 [Nannocystaceae bacterium]|nr:hypothetical protein [Nannocystaceae bacterium]
MAQGFYFTNTLQATSWTAVGTVWLQAARVLSFRGGGGGGQIGTRGVGLLFASTTVSIAKRLGIGVSYEYLRGPVIRHAGLVAGGVKF